MNAFFRKLNWLLRRRTREAELREELEFHLAEEAEEREAAGIARKEAQFAARRELGNLTLMQEDTRAVWISTFWDQMSQDARYACRTMAGNKIFSGLAILSLALGIGANTAIFSMMDSILLRSLPVDDPASLVRLTWHAHARGMSGTYTHDSAYRDPETGFNSGVFPFPAFDLFRRNGSPFSSVFGYNGAEDVSVIIAGQAELVVGEYVSGDYFPGLGVPPAAGRLIYSDDDRAGAPPVAVLSYAVSEKRFGGAGKAVGQRILINNIPFTVAGVTAPEFFGVDPGQAPGVYLPMHTNLLLEAADLLDPPAKRYFDQKYQWVEVMARLRPGVTVQQAQTILAPLYREWAVNTAESDDDRAHLPALTVREGRGGIDGLRRQYSKPLFLLMTLVGLILALTCANIANLLLARAAARRREMAVRLTMGAGRLRVIRQLLTESVLLAFAGGAFGVALAVWGVRSLSLLLEHGAHFGLHPGLNWHVLGIAAGLCLLTGVLFGLAPAMQAARVDVMPALKESRTGTHQNRRLSLSHLLVVAQIAISLIMLMSAGLFVRTLSNLQSIELGFSRENLLLVELNAQAAGHGDADIAAFYGDLRKRFTAIPGVRSATLSKHPLMSGGTSGQGISVNGVQEPKANLVLAVGPAFFTTIQIPVLRGREIDERDQPGSPMAAVVNEVFARTIFGDRNPLGQHVAVMGRGPLATRDMEIVGVTGNARYGNLRTAAVPVLYFPYNQGSIPPLNSMVFELRTVGNPFGYVKAVREIVHQADPRLPVAEPNTQAGLIDQDINQEITFARLSTGFAVLALVIACVGLYGTMAYKVARRTGEIGIRMALGARAGAVVWIILREVLAVAVAGLTISVPVVLLTSKLVKVFLFGMEANDPAALEAAGAILLIATLLAGYVPARKASRIDPMRALRHE